MCVVFFFLFFFFFFKQKTAYEIMPSLVGSEMCIRDSSRTVWAWTVARERATVALPGECAFRRRLGAGGIGVKARGAPGPARRPPRAPRGEDGTDGSSAGCLPGRRRRGIPAWRSTSRGRGLHALAASLGGGRPRFGIAFARYDPAVAAGHATTPRAERGRYACRTSHRCAARALLGDLSPDGPPGRRGLRCRRRARRRRVGRGPPRTTRRCCLLYTSDAADDLLCV